MSAAFEQIDSRQTAIGEISLRRRLDPALQIDVYEVKLGDEYLMSSLFTESEVALATLGLTALTHPDGDLDVVVGGLGLGYTARAVLDEPRVRSLHVIEALPEVIDWHQRQLLPHAHQLTSDPRCHLVNTDFFATIAAGARFGPTAPQRHHAILVDIDHTPRHVLHPSHTPFYQPAGLQRLAQHLHPGGVFALWSDDPPDPDFITNTQHAFATCEAHIVTFPNPHTTTHGTSTIYVAVAAGKPPSAE